jgi:heat shock protein HslJ
MGHIASQGSGSTARWRGGLALIGLALAGALVLAACGSSDSGSEATSTTKASGTKSTSASTTTSAASTGKGELDGTQWQGSGIEGYEPVPDSQLVVTFDDGRMVVHAGCNTLGAAYEVDDGTLSWSDAPAATMMACSDELEAQDAWLTDLFTNGVDGAVDGATLTLTSGDVTITLDQVEDAPLVGTEWTLEGTLADDAVASLPEGAEPPTLTIGEDGTAAAFTGCNRGSTQVEIADDTLTFGPMALTRMACEDAAMQLEGHVVQVLDGEVTYAVDGQTLTITNGSAGLTYRAG